MSWTPSGGGTTSFLWKRGPVRFNPSWTARCHDNLATSGKVRERVMEAAADILISLEMPHLVIADDAEGWAVFLAWAIPGGQFKLYPDANIDWYVNCVMESEGVEMARNAPKKYGIRIAFRVLQDSQFPASPVAILRRLYGINS